MYADDVIVLIKHLKDVDVLFKLTNSFNHLSAARQIDDWQKSEALAVGSTSPKLILS